MAKRNSNKDNLTKIKGIGPKLQSILNAGGIMTFSDLAKAKKTAIKKILEDAGPRYKAYDPTPWMAEAKGLAKASTTTSKPKPKPKKKPRPRTETPPKAKTKAKPKAKPKSKPEISKAASKIKAGELDLPRFRKIMRELKNNTEDLTKMTVRKYRKDAKRDADRLLRGMRRDLRRWTRLLENGDLSTMDFEFLVQSNVDSAKMSALQNSGLATIRLQAYRSSLYNMIIDTIFGLAFRVIA